MFTRCAGRRRFSGICIHGWILMLGFVGCVSSVDYAALRPRAEQGDPQAQFRLAVALDRAGDPEAARWYRAAAEQGFIEAQNSLGSLYQAGLGVPRDYTEAAAWYRKASDQGHAEATNNLGYLYDLGLGTSQDNVTAARLYETAAERGSTNAMLNLGVLLAQGPPAGLAVDVVEAYKWLSLASLYALGSRNRDLIERSRRALDHLRSGMTASEISDGDRRTEAWDATHRAGVREEYPAQRVSILPPRGFGWFSLPKDALRPEQFAGFGRRLRDTRPRSADEARSVVAVAALLDGSAFGSSPDSPLESAEDLAAAIKQSQARPSGARRRLLDATIAIDRSLGFECVRYEEQIEDVGVPGFPSSVFVELQRGIRCIHPSLSGRVVDLGYSERHVREVEPLDFRSEAQRFVESLEFIAPPAE